MEINNEKIFEEAIKELDKKFGKGTFNSTSDSKIETISSGSVSLNNILGNNGFPKGKIIEIFGNESSGKTTIALQTVNECIKQGGRVAYIDAENSLDINYVINNGIDPDKMLLAHPESGEQTFSIIDALVKTNMIDLIVVDSVAALVPESELKGEIYDQSMGLHARLMSKGLRMIQHSVSKHNVCVIFINQLREKIGVVFGNPEQTTGGKALKFFSSIRLEVRRSELLKNGNEILGIKSKITTVKNKLAAPFQYCFVDIFFNKGYDYQNEIINFALIHEVIVKKGSWFYFGEQKLCQGRINLNNYLKENNDLYEEIKKQVLDICVPKN